MQIRKSKKIYNKKRLLLLASTYILVVSGGSILTTIGYSKNGERKTQKLDEQHTQIELKQNKNKNEKETEIKESNTVNMLSNISYVEAHELFYENGQLNVDEISDEFFLESIGNVKDIKKDGKNYLVSAIDICNIIISDYQSIGPLCYDIVNDTYTYTVLKNDKDYLINAKELSVMMVSYDYARDPIFLKKYHCSYGGYDTGYGAGYVKEVCKNGIKYLVDATDYNQILISGYEEIEENNDEIIVTYPNGTKKTYLQYELIPEQSNILTEELSRSR